MILLLGSREPLFGTLGERNSSSKKDEGSSVKILDAALDEVV